jgi:membrane protease YdiL (CAAX protease family)
MSDTPDLARGPLDIQHDTDPAREVPPARRIPHLGHAILYFSLNSFCILLGVVLFLTVAHDTSNEAIRQHPFLATLGQYTGEITTILVAVPLFPVFWRYGFWQGISWNLRAARLNWWKLVLAGLALSVGAEAALSLSHAPSDSDILQLFRTPAMAWTTSLIAAFVAPLAEEIAFRGFLLPALATAYDWLALERTPAGLARWEQTATHTPMAWIFATFFTSIAFSVIHGGQNHWHPGVLIVLFFVSSCLCFVFIRLRSVAASVLFHTSYNLFPLITQILLTHSFHHLDKLT